MNKLYKLLTLLTLKIIFDGTAFLIRIFYYSASQNMSEENVLNKQQNTYLYFVYLIYFPK